MRVGVEGTADRAGDFLEIAVSEKVNGDGGDTGTEEGLGASASGCTDDDGCGRKELGKVGVDG